MTLAIIIIVIIPYFSIPYIPCHDVRYGTYTQFFSPGGIECCTADLSGLVRPFVRMHVVDVHTGRYLKSKQRPAAAPLTTRWFFVIGSSVLNLVVCFACGGMCVCYLCVRVCVMFVFECVLCVCCVCVVCDCVLDQISYPFPSSLSLFPVSFPLLSSL